MYVSIYNMADINSYNPEKQQVFAVFNYFSV
jgi:hypothetical protein